MPVRHAMLVITRAVFDMVEIPGQEPLVVAKDTGDEAARRWWHDRVRAVAADVFERTSDAGNANWRTGRQARRWPSARSACTRAVPGWTWPGSGSPTARWRPNRGSARRVIS
jgi:hypothetical protein